MKFVHRFFLILVFPAVSACNGGDTLWEGTCGSRPCKLEIVEAPGAVTSYIYPQLQIEEHPPLPLSPETVDSEGMPYSKDIFGQTPHMYFPSAPEYSSASSRGSAGLIYVDNRKFNAEAYAAFQSFFAKEWDKIRAGIKDQKTVLPAIGGIVHGAREEFTRVFPGTWKNRGHYFAVTPDGTVSFAEGRGPAQAQGVNIQTPLAPKVRMPGKVIRISDSVVFSKQLLRTFRDDHNKSLEDYFMLEYK